MEDAVGDAIEVGADMLQHIGHDLDQGLEEQQKTAELGGFALLPRVEGFEAPLGDRVERRRRGEADGEKRASVSAKPMGAVMQCDDLPSAITGRLR